MPRGATKKEIRKPGMSWRIGLIVACFIVGCVTTAVAGLQVQEYARTEPRFRLSRERPGALTVEGLQHTSRAKVQRVFAADFENSVFGIPLAERRRRLLAIDWVEEATVSRLWPDRVVVRLRERMPVAYVSARGGVLLIDAFGVLLEPPPQSKFSFPVLHGVREDEPESKRRERMRAFLAMYKDLGELAKDVSEVNVSDPEDLSLIVRVENRALELSIGNENFGRRYANFLHNYPAIRRGSPEVSAFNLRMDGQVITVKGRE